MCIERHSTTGYVCGHCHECEADADDTLGQPVEPDIRRSNLVNITVEHEDNGCGPRQVLRVDGKLVNSCADTLEGRIEALEHVRSIGYAFEAIGVQYKRPAW